MLNTRISKAVILVAIGALAVVAASLGRTPRTSQEMDDFGLRHPAGLVASAQDIRSNEDFALRHPTGLVASAPNAGYFVRSDYAERHPELSNAAVDTSDYFLRHPELLTVAGAPDDYFLRHWTSNSQ